MKKAYVIAIVVGASLMLGGQFEQISSGPVHAVEYSTDSIPALHPLSDGMTVKYSATLLRRGANDFRTVNVTLHNRSESAYIAFSGTPEEIDAIAKVAEAYATSAAMPQSTRINGRDLALKTTISDDFPAMQLRVGGTELGLTFTMGPNKNSLTVLKNDIPNLVASLKDAAQIGKQLP